MEVTAVWYMIGIQCASWSIDMVCEATVPTCMDIIIDIIS